MPQEQYSGVRQRDGLLEADTAWVDVRWCLACGLSLRYLDEMVPRGVLRRIVLQSTAGWLADHPSL